MIASLFSRRDFLKILAYGAALLGIRGGVQGFIDKVFAEDSKRPTLVWLSALSCGGCTESFFAIEEPDASELLFNVISLRYNRLTPEDYSNKDFSAISDEDSYLLFVEGSFPQTDEGFCLINGEPAEKLLKDLLQRAEHTVAVGSCASFGGIPSLGPARAASVSDIVKNKNVINLPTCPVHPDHLILIIMHLLYFGYAPELDDYQRPKMFFKNLIHDSCERRTHFENQRFLKDFNDPSQSDYCLYLVGCKGRQTNSDCSKRKWNGNLSWCVDCGAGCNGCAEKNFYTRFSPLFETQDKASELSEDVLKFGAGAVAGASSVWAANKIKERLQKRENSREV
ncbi:MAG: hydrogenase small subunit [Actinobacteria bacterium]|nr:hydrogenase small subunit [Actinomycetota bacterium]